eukprot:CAMPEP_0167756472 /NCGR_PEP_ID=MMETSP0110_2-20121227/9404_1 /TAXON_ID=629695 /ORGANISM="Gymnochlora sp., Strain CCMP2014" /LENGTH=265 /DNA_ID=CAMNT_0007642585 /DNA_START=124 /DNA_END=918 /DNA_ORIENTATION=+
MDKLSLLVLLASAVSATYICPNGYKFYKDPVVLDKNHDNYVTIKYHSPYMYAPYKSVSHCEVTLKLVKYNYYTSIGFKIKHSTCDIKTVYVKGSYWTRTKHFSPPVSFYDRVIYTKYKKGIDGITFCFDPSKPTPLPTNSPTASPTASPTDSPVSAVVLTENPSASPSASPSSSPTLKPSEAPSSSPSASPSASPTTLKPSKAPSSSPSASPSASPTLKPSEAPSSSPSSSPSESPTLKPSEAPSSSPSASPSASPTLKPSEAPS